MREREDMLMNYERFKESLLAELKDFYGKDAEVAIIPVQKNNGQTYDGLQIIFTAAKWNVNPIINVEDLYRAYMTGGINMNGCVEAVYHLRQENECSEVMIAFATRLQDWNYVKEHVYPSLLPTNKNGRLLEGLVSVPIMDLSIVYIIRENIQGFGRGVVKVSREMLDNYGITGKELHEQAVKNLEKDDYSFREMREVLNKIAPEFMTEEICDDPPDGCKMYVLTNAEKAYGAAGILSRKLMRKFAGSRSFYILPSSIHETIFVPADGNEQSGLDNMVAEVNRIAVKPEEYLSDHSYFYDGTTGEIRMCA